MEFQRTRYGYALKLDAGKDVVVTDRGVLRRVRRESLGFNPLDLGVPPSTD